MFYYNNGHGWFRIFGSGLTWKDMRKYELTFSERLCYTRWVKIGKWCIGVIN